MRVLHVTPYFAPAFCYGGPPRSVLGLCRGLQRLGLEIEVFTTTANGGSDLPASPPEGDRYEGIPVRYFPLGFPGGLFGARGLGRVLTERIARYDLVHVHGLWHLPGWMAACRARQRGVPYVISPRGMLDRGSWAHHRIRKEVVYRVVERPNLSAAAFLHATSAAEARTLEQRGFGVPIVALPNGLDVDGTAPPSRGIFRLRLAIGEAVPLLVYLGRIHPTKRLDLLAAAFERVRAVHRQAQLVVAGPDEEKQWRREGRHFARAGASVHRIGELDDAEKWSLLADADALVMCSDSESFGMSVLEAMAVGVPVVATETCPWEEIEAVRCGFWVPQRADAIADALLQLLHDRGAARAMGERGRGLARIRYSWDSIARSMAERYRGVASARAPLATL